MKASLLFSQIEKQIPISLAVKGDIVGYIGTEEPEILEVNKVLVLMDYDPSRNNGVHNYSSYDLLILHHPPIVMPVLPTYIIHSNWDIVPGGACDALADSLNITSFDNLDGTTGIGRIGRFVESPVILGRFIREIMLNLRIKDVRVVNCNKFKKIETIGLVSGFGLQPEYIQMAIDKGVDVFVSGDLTHKGAILAKHAGIILIDATHYATEFPGLCRLGKLIASIGPDVHVHDTSYPWVVSSLKNGG